MKKIFDKKTIFSFILGMILCSGIVYGVNSYQSNTIEYNPTDASWEVSNVSDAINSLHSMVKEFDNIKSIGDATADDILEGKTAVVQGKLITGTNSGSGIVDLGLGKSFDIKTLAPDVDYKNLTKDSFIVECINNTVTSNGFLSDNHDSTWHWVKASVSIDKSYNATVGILTVSCIYRGLVYSSANGNIAEAKSTNEVHAYLVY